MSNVIGGIVCVVIINIFKNFFPINENLLKAYPARIPIIKVKNVTDSATK